jgi:hypothetical protein
LARELLRVTGNGVLKTDSVQLLGDIMPAENVIDINLYLVTLAVAE